MTRFATRLIAPTPDAIAPDGSQVRLLCGLSRGGMAHFALPPGAVSKAVVHQTIEEIWYFLRGSGRMWRRLDGEEQIVEVMPGVSITLPTGTHFQFRSDGDEPLEAIGVTMPPWPGPEEAREVTGAWAPTV